MRMDKRLLAIPILAILAAPWPYGSDPTTVSVEPVFTVYMSSTGSDVNDGLTTSNPVKTLERVESIISTTQPDENVEVRIDDKGLYLNGQTTWNTFLPGHTISFMPSDFQVGMGLADIAGRPVFRASGPAAWWLYAQIPSNSPGMTTGLKFYYLQVEHYQSGLMIHGRYATVDGVRVPSTDGANGNEIRGMYFYQLGSKYNSYPGYGVAALDLVNSSNNYIRANQFLYLENNTPDQSHIHAVYQAHGSSNNIIINNKLRYISGAGINIRNRSNGTEVTGNTFDHVGVHGQLSDWFCDGTCVTTDANPQECASSGTNFHDNILGVGYTGATIPRVVLTPSGNTYSGSSPCSNFAAGTVRVFGNNY